MSFDGFDNWNPMQEDYSNNFSSQNRVMGSTSRDVPYDCTLFVKNIPQDLDRITLARIFSKYGKVKETFVKRRPDQCPTYGFVHFYSKEDAQSVYHRIPKPLYGLEVQLAHAPKNNKSHAIFPSFAGSSGNRQHQMGTQSSEAKVGDFGEMNHIPIKPVRSNVPLEIRCKGTDRSVALLNSPPDASFTEVDRSYGQNHCKHSYGTLVDEGGSDYEGNDHVAVYDEPPGMQGHFYNMHSVVAEHVPHSNYGHTRSHRKKTVLANPLRKCQPIRYYDDACLEPDVHCDDDAFPQEDVPPSPTYIHSCNSRCYGHCIGDHGCTHRHGCCHRQASGCHGIGSTCPHDCASHRTSINCDNVPSDLPRLKQTLNQCSYCGNEGPFVCTVCGEPYCSRKCQEAHWPSHRIVCGKAHSPTAEGCVRDKSSCNSNGGFHDAAKASNGISPTARNGSDAALHRNMRSPSGSQNMSLNGLERHNQRNKKPIDACNLPSDPTHHEKIRKECGAELRTGCIEEASRVRSISSDGQEMDNHRNKKSVHENNGSSDRIHHEKMKESNAGFKKGSDQAASSVHSISSDQGGLTQDLNQAINKSKHLMDKATEKRSSINERLKSNSLARSDIRPPVDRNANILVAGKVKYKDMKMVKLNASENEKVMVCYARSPDEFWIHRSSDMDTIRQIEVGLAELQQQKTVYQQPAIDDVCASLYVDGKLYRCRITKLAPTDCCEVFYIDYGNTAVSKISDLCYLTAKLSTYPSVAVCCKLADVIPPNSSEWQSEDMEFFMYLIDAKVLKACVVDAELSRPTVDLITEDGLSVSSVLVNEKNARWISDVGKLENNSLNTGNPGEVSLMYEVPSVLKYLEQNQEIAVLPILVQKSKFWCWVNVPECLKKIQTMEVAIQKDQKEEVTLMAEEGDLAVTFSPTYEVWYRCLILKRLPNSIKVRYIDYGNEEEVAKLYKIAPEHINVCSPLLHVDASKLPQDVLKKWSVDGFHALVASLKNTAVELSVKHSARSVNVCASPWYEGISDKLDITVPTENEAVCANGIALSCDRPTKMEHSTQGSKRNSIAPAKLTGRSERPVTKKSKNLINEPRLDLTQAILVDRDLPCASKTQVIVTWVNQKNELFVQKVCDASECEELTEKLNKHCNSVLQSKHVPVVGNIVCAKYSVDQNWYRSLVKKCLPRDMFHVLFIDYGNEEEVSIEDLRPISEKFCCPKFCVCVQLHNAPSKITTNEISQRVCGKFLSLAVVDAAVMPLMVGFYEGDKEVFPTIKAGSDILPVLRRNTLKSPCVTDFHLSEVRIAHVDSSKNFHVQLMSSRSDYLALKKEMFCLFKECTELAYTPEVEDVVCVLFNDDYHRGVVLDVLKSTCIVEFVDDGFTEEVAQQQIKPLRTPLLQNVLSLAVELEGVEKDVLIFEVCENLKSTPVKLELVNSSTSPPRVKFYVGDLCVNEHLPVSEVNDVSNASTHYSPSPTHSYLIESFKQQTLPLSQTVDVVFWFAEKDNYFLHQISDIDSIEKMSAVLQVHCAESKHLTRTPSAGEIICAKCPADQIWYRACVQKVSDRGCDVIFVDYGNSETVVNADLCALPEELVSLPIYSICVKAVNTPEPLNFGMVYSVNTSGTKMNPIVEFPIPSALHSEVSKVSFSLDSFKCESLPLNKTLDVVFWYQEGDKFFLQKVSDLKSMEEMSTVLQEHCNESLPLGHKLSVEEVVCAKCCADQTWYRACVQKVLPDNKYEVIFIDFGNSETIEGKDLRIMPQELTVFPIYGIEVTAKNMPNPLSFGTVYSVSTSGTEQNPIVEVVNLDQVGKSQSLPIHPSENVPNESILLTSLKRQTLSMKEKLEVVFWFCGNDRYFLQKVSDVEEIEQMSVLLQKHCFESVLIMHKPLVGEVLCARCSTDHVWYRACVKKLITDSRYEVVFIDYGNSEVVDEVDLRFLSKELSAFPIFAIEVKACNVPEPLTFGVVHSVNTDGTVQDPVVEFCSEVSKENVQEKDAECVPEASNRAPPVALLSDCDYVDFPLGQTTVIVYSITSSDAVFCAPFVETNIAANTELQLQIHSFCNDSNIPGYKPVVVNEIVLAKYPVDNDWYRATVVEINGDEFVVCFVDYGGVAVITSDSIKKVEPQFMKLPIQSHLCKLGGLSYSDGNADQVDMEIVSTLPVFTALDAVVSKEDEYFILEIPSVNKHLQQKGLLQ